MTSFSENSTFTSFFWTFLIISVMITWDSVWYQSYLFKKKKKKLKTALHQNKNQIDKQLHLEEQNSKTVVDFQKTILCN